MAHQATALQQFVIFKQIANHTVSSLKLFVCMFLPSPVDAAKSWCHVAVRVLPGGVWCAGLFKELCTPQPSCQQSISGGHGADDPAQLQVSIIAT